MYGYDEANDPVFVKSLTGYVTNVEESPVQWQSKLQRKTTSSIIKTESTW